MFSRQSNARKTSGRPKLRQRDDLRITIRLRYHCDQDLIRLLEGVSNRNDLVRRALRFWLAEARETNIP